MQYGAYAVVLSTSTKSVLWTCRAVLDARELLVGPKRGAVRATERGVIQFTPKRMKSVENADTLQVRVSGLAFPTENKPIAKKRAPVRCMVESGIPAAAL